jgi:hypothetical protein
MDLKEILSHLERNEGYFPRAAVREASDHRDEVIPALLGILEDVPQGGMTTMGLDPPEESLSARLGGRHGPMQPPPLPLLR